MCLLLVEDDEPCRAGSSRRWNNWSPMPAKCSPGPGSKTLGTAGATARKAILWAYSSTARANKLGNEFIVTLRGIGYMPVKA